MNATRHTREVLKSLFDAQRFAVLATDDGGQPYVSLMAFVATDDLKHLIFATERETRKYANLASNPRVAALIDNRSNRTSDTGQAIAVTALGRMGEWDKAPQVGAFLERHPHLETFVRSPTCALVGMAVTTYVVVRGLEDVQELRP